MNTDPFAPGKFPVGVRTLQASDSARDRLFPCEIWYPAVEESRDAAARPGTWPLVVFSHPSGLHRRTATFLCTHLASHGYVVGALDHSEVVAPELARREGETAEQRAARIEGSIASRVPDARFLLDYLLEGPAWDPGVRLDASRIGVVGHSFGGWTALALPEADSRIRAVVALAPGGSSNPRPGILPLKLTFEWGRDIPTLYIAAENDAAIPLAGVYELLERTPGTRLLAILHRADHAHFVDDVEDLHEGFRRMPVGEELKRIQADMLPIEQLCPAAEAHRFVRGLTLAHMGAALQT